MNKLIEHKINQKRILKSIAKQWFKIHKIKKVIYRKTLSGCASVRIKKIEIPPATTRNRMYIIAHELGHIFHNHISNKKRFIEEYEAEKYAHYLMKKYKIKIPRKMTTRAKQYVTRKIYQAKARGLKSEIPSNIKRWIA